MTTEGRISQQAARSTERPVDNSMRAKQLVASVRQGRRIEVDILDEGWTGGYLAGWDDDTYLVLVPQTDEVEKYLIPKTHILMIRLVDERTFREEALYEDMEAIVKPFRDVLNNLYPKTPRA